MHIYVRRFLLFISYTAFVIIAPLVILYAIGYRPQISSPIPRPVGVILADAAPRRATITVNETSYGTLPRSVSNIEPGIVTVQIQKEGYISWQKQLDIKPTQATDIRSVQLLPLIPDTEVIAPDATTFAIAPNNSLTAITQANNQLLFLDESSSPVFPAEKLLGKPLELLWSPDGAYLLVTLPKNTYQLFHVNETTLSKVATKELAGMTQLRWSPISATTLYGMDKNKAVVSYNIATEIKTIVVRNVNAYELTSRTMYYQTFQNELLGMQLRSLDSRTLLDDTEKAIKEISANASGSLALLFSDGELRIQKQNGDTLQVSSHGEHMSWSPDGQLLLVQTSPTELNIYNVENERLFAIPLHELQLITRLSQPISNTRWFPDGLHILYESNGTLFFSEIDTRDHAISLPVDTIHSSSPVTTGEQSKNIMYLKQEGTSSKLVRTWLLTEEDR